jgi:hypothetical protein
MAIFRMMNEKFLHLDLNEDFWREAAKEDPYQFPRASPTKYDRQSYGITWNEPDVELSVQAEKYVK